MEFFIKKIFEGKCQGDELVHLQFQKFSKGEFKYRAVVNIKNSSEKFSISTTPEYSNEFVRFLAEKLGDRKTKVIGIIVSTRNFLNGELDFQGKKQFMGVKQYQIDKEMSGKEILEICDKLPNSFIGLSFSVGDTELKIKPKAPKTAKPSTKNEETPKADFCKLKTSDLEIVKNLLFEEDAQNFKTAEIAHNFFINDIVISEDLKKQTKNDFALIREKALRSGKIMRKLKIDGKEFIKEKEFMV